MTSSDSETEAPGQAKVAQRSGCMTEMAEELQIVFAKSPSIVECEQEKLSSRETCLLILIFLLFSIGVTLAVVVAEIEGERAAEQNKKDNDKKAAESKLKTPEFVKYENICLTKECIAAADRILNSLDTNVNPCDDFYSYACNGWLRNNPTPASRNIWSVMDKLLLQIRDVIKTQLSQPLEGEDLNNTSAVGKTRLFYQRCMGMVRSEMPVSLFDVIDDVGGWHLLGTLRNWYPTMALAGIHFRHWADAIFYVNVGPDIKNRSRNIVQLDKAGLGLPSAYYTTEANSVVTQKYKAFIESVGRLLGLDNQDARHFKLNVFSVETKLARLIESTSNSDDPKNINILQLEQMCSMINWRAYFQKGGFRPADYTEILVENLDYFRKLDRFLSSGDSALNDYFVWKLYLRYQDFLGLELRSAGANFLNVKTGETETKSRSDVCFEATEEWFNMALTNLYIDHVPFNDKHAVIEIVNNVKDALVSFLPKLPWLNGIEAQSIAKKKAALLHYKIAYPDVAADVTKLDRYYQNMAYSGNASMLEILTATMDGQTKKMVASLHRPDKKEWQMAPYITNAYYTAILNEIVIPIGFLQDPYFNIDQPQYLNYASIGAILGHELSHGFDPSGSQYDGYGSDDWFNKTKMSSSASELTNQKLQCIEDVISESTYQGIKVNGRRMREEVLSDTGGLKASLKAYQTNNVDVRSLPGVNNTNSRIFFIAYAQTWCESIREEVVVELLHGNVHPPSKIRVNTAVSQIKNFADEFKCPIDSPMNPRNRCDIW
ncbi:endothelin-converting enzyme homolog [Tubulanus polymorphus]|uniref:endothelin-converting enzyme homolog n=1 Tax=Tubulanus polymorphus TaxID=672921 RepID=UPI003DA22D83